MSDVTGQIVVLLFNALTSTRALRGVILHLTVNLPCTRVRDNTICQCSLYSNSDPDRWIPNRS